MANDVQYMYSTVPENYFWMSFLSKKYISLYLTFMYVFLCDQRRMIANVWKKVKNLPNLLFREKRKMYIYQAVVLGQER